jgi:hypothetical protein
MFKMAANKPQRAKRTLLPLKLALLALGAASAPAPAAPANDSFADRAALSDSSVTIASNAGATVEPDEPLHADQPGGHSVWWVWMAPRDGSVTLSTSGSDLDTLLAVYTGPTLATLTAVASNDDASFNETTSRLSFTASAGTVYHIAVDGYDGDEGVIQLNLLVNDNFGDRLSLSGTDLSLAAHNFDATAEPGEPNHAGQPAARSVWWTWTAPGHGNLALKLSGDNTNTAGAPFYKLLAVYTGSDLSGLTLRADSGSVFMLTNQLTLDIAGGTPYQIAADGVGAAMGRLQLELAFTPAPANDNFTDRITLRGINVTATGSNVGATKEPGEPDHAGYAGGHSVWWSWMSPTNGSVALELSGSIPSKLLAVYTGDALSSLAAVRSNLTSEATNRITFNVTAGTSYQIAVDGHAGQTGNVLLKVQFRPGPANDRFQDRIALPADPGNYSGSNLGATSEPGEPNHGGYPAHRSVWWSWTAPANGVVTLTIAGDNASADGGPFYKLIGVYSGPSLGELVTNALSSGLVLTNRVTFDVAGSRDYAIAVDGYNGGQGAVQLSLDFAAAPPNDDFADRFVLSGPVTSVTGSNVAATRQPGEPNHASLGGQSVWWTWTAPAAGRVVVSTAGSSFDTLLAVYRGTNVSSLVSVVSNNDFAGQRASEVSFGAVGGTAYQIAVDGFLQDAGAVRLTLSQRGASKLEQPGFGAEGAFEFIFTGQAGARYTIEASTNLLDWLPVRTLTNSVGSLPFADLEATNGPARFYRAKLE